LKLLTFADTNITAIQWEPQAEAYLAQATIDKKLVIWDIEPETIKFQVQLISHITQIEWNPNKSQQLFCVQSNGEMKIVDLERKKVESVDVNTSTNSKPTVVRCHPKRPDIVAVGLENGRVYFLNMRTHETFVFDACDTEARIKARIE
jgi:WD40 repeat protein